MNGYDNGKRIKLSRKTCIYHYMNIEHLISMLSNKFFYVASKCLYTDPYESKMLPLRMSFAFSIVGDNAPPIQHTAKVQNEINKKQFLFRKESHLLTSCWSMGPNENYLLWKGYTTDKYGVCIKSTIGKVVESILDNDFEIWCGKMLYRRRQQTDLPDDAKWFKNIEYKGEDEVRFYFLPKDNIKYGANSNDTAYLGCDTGLLIDKIILSPFLTVKEYDAVAENIAKTGWLNRNKIVKSKIEINENGEK